jgi:glucan 1,3-beta-glucosidase
MIDLHGAPLSQNGFDNSGQRTADPQWQQGDSVAETLAVLNTISTKYAASEYQDVVSSIELLNEPLGSKLSLDGIKDFYKKGYEQVRQTSDTPVILHDAFNSPSSWNGFLSTSDNGAYNGTSPTHSYPPVYSR